MTFIIAAAAISAAASGAQVEWYSTGNYAGPNGSTCHNERIVVTDPGAMKQLCFNRLSRDMATVNPADSLAEIIPGYYAIISPRLSTHRTGTVEIELTLPWGIENMNYAPDGFHAVMADGSVVPVKFTRRPLSERKDWALVNRDRMPLGSDIYRFNESIAYTADPGPYDIIPSFKSVNIAEGGALVPVNTPVAIHPIADEHPDFYSIAVAPDSIVISYTSNASLAMAQRVLHQRLIPANPAGLPAAVIEDYPTFPYRAMMMDISRNYFNAAELQKLVHILATYRLNTLHFHPFDDEAWRLEIDGLPELTEVGARRGYTTDEHEFLAQLFAGNGNPNSDAGTSNGYLTRQEFIDFLKYCGSMGITVVPEIESPGHARAAIKSMEAYARRTGDTSLLLSEGSDDSSVYTSAQAFHDNVMNPALPGPYKFMGKVFDALIAMYDEAGVPLPGIHIGGDEVPAKAWANSPSVQKMMRDRGLTSQRQVHAAFVDSLAGMLASRGVKLFGWQEIANDHDPAYNRHVAPLTGGVNCWTNVSQGTAPKAIADGFPVILSCVDRFYLDQMYNNHPLERGLNWGGNVDEFTTFGGYPDAMGIDYRVVSPAGGRVIGLSGHLFGETLRRPEDVQYMVLPKIMGLAERAWNPDSTYSASQFNAIIAERELPCYARKGYNFHLRQPGLLIEDGMIKMNSPYRNAVIRYTLDGTEPTEESPVYTTPIPVTPGADPRARLFYLGHKSLVTWPAP